MIKTGYKLDTLTHVFFYEQEFYVLSNFSAFRLYWVGLDFDTSEAAYQYEKFRSMPDEPIRENIRRDIYEARSAHDAFKIAETNQKYVRPEWPVIKVDVMRSILLAKAQQHEYVRRKLLETGNRELIEDSFRDSFWGWGPNKDGLNMLGKLWMEIRDKLSASVS
jgi:ribA/ribD-fused uncharacterized protein